MKHIFLTGEIQIGKSTVIQKTLRMLRLKYGGFRTYFSADRSNPDRRLYIGRAEQPLLYDEANVVARFSPVLPPEAYPERFDCFGGRYITQAAGSADLIIMDECGNLENQALRFQHAVLTALDGSIPILGVVKLAAGGWVDTIRSHPGVMLVTVDKQNRDALPAMLTDALRKYSGHHNAVPR